RWVKGCLIEDSNSIPLYAEDSYLKEFKARVVKSGPKFVVLDRTAFYPESGGQPSDTGILVSGESKVRVFKVLRRGFEIFHYIEGELEKGLEVHGVIDWAHRFWNMRRHSCEHLLTNLFEKAGTGPKVYSDLTRLEFMPSSIGEEDLKKVESEFKEVVEADLPIRIYYADKSKVDVGDDVRKLRFLEKIPRSVGSLRMVEVLGYSPIFCFGTHVKSTGEIGSLSSLRLESGRKNRKIVYFSLVPATLKKSTD
ncbi:alanyl-tRNA editing protein, partial [Candidatus Bathyarchaeota archaeon]|nr:alanyl-tRNA editing protein [Candidatus Bathyarchaeota archaeon]